MNHRQQIRAFIIDNFFVEEFEDNESFLRSGIIDSMGMAQLVAFVEERFQIHVADEELVPENLDSLERVVAFVERKVLSRSAV